jgi:hypothetical protein
MAFFRKRLTHTKSQREITVQILSYRPEQSGGSAIARFDVDLDGVRLNNLVLKQTKSGLRVFGPSAFGRAVVTFTPDRTMALIAAVRGATAHDAA